MCSNEKRRSPQYLEGAPEWFKPWMRAAPERFGFCITATKPVPKLRERRGNGKRPRTPAKVRDYELKVAWEAAHAGALGEHPVFEGDVFMVALFESTDKRLGDLTNLLKSVEDGLNGKEIKFKARAEFWEGVFRSVYEKGQKETLGRAWEDDRNVAGVNAFRAFTEDDRVTVGVVRAGDFKALHDWLDAVEAGPFEDLEAVTL